MCGKNYWQQCCQIFFTVNLTDNKINSNDYNRAVIISRQHTPYISLIRESIEIFTRQHKVCNDNICGFQ